ncbi:MAG: winged helix-turn-helix transcriptional regulator [Candidatus Diapherotrites archaeon]|nr:winged helix-turn-helix transcriptional regulator [Candidatus Diapherotrites archaeon]
MGMFDFLRKKSKKTKAKPTLEESELKKTLSKRHEQKNTPEATMLMESMEVQAPRVYSPAVEHPLLTIQDRISKLEEIYKSMNDRVIVIDGKVATKQDIDDLKAMVHEDISKGDRVLVGIDGLGDKLEDLRATRGELTRQVDTSRHELTRQVKALDEIDEKIDLLECDEKIINALGESELSTIGLAEEIGLTRQYIWGRLKALQAAGYVESVKSGRKTKYRLLKEL